MVKLFRLHQVAVHTVVAGKVDDLVLAFKGIIGGRVLGYRRATPARMRRDASAISSRFTTSRPNSSAGSSAFTPTAGA